MSETDPEFLQLEDVLALVRRMFGDPLPIRDMGLLGSAVERPQTTVFGEDAYPDIWTKAAALCHSVANNHALVDGNERLAWVATATFLEINDIDVSAASNDDVYDFVISVVVDHQEIAEIAEQLRAIISGTA